MSSIIAFIMSNLPSVIGGLAAAGVGFLWLRMTYFKSRYTALQLKYDKLLKVYQDNLRTYNAVVKQYNATVTLLKAAADRDATLIRRQNIRKEIVAKSTTPVKDMDTVDDKMAGTLNDILGNTPK